MHIEQAAVAPRVGLARIRRYFAGSVALAMALPLAASEGQRLPVIPQTQYSEAQRQAAAEFLAARKFAIEGPFEAMLYSPEVMTRMRAMGDYLRYKSAIGNTLSELVILITAREW